MFVMFDRFNRPLLAVVLMSVCILLCTLSKDTFAQTIEHSSGKCFRTQNNSASPSNGTVVVLDSDCSGDAAQFSWTAGGSLKHVPTDMCVHPGDSATPANGTQLVLWDGCDFADRVRFNRTSDGSMQQISSGKCVHSSDGSVNPSDGTALVMWDGCNEARLEFTEKAATISNRAQLVSAIASANTGDVLILSSSFSYQDTIAITKSVIIEGSGKTINHSVPISGDFAEYTPAFVIAADNVILRNFTVIGDNRNGFNALIELNNKGTISSNNFTLYNVTLQNATAGLRNQGIIPSNLNIENNTFRNLNKAVDLTRDAALGVFTRHSTDFFDTAGSRIFYQNAGSLNISNNRIFVDAGQTAMQVGIQIDSGNDGFNEDEAPGFPTNTSAYRGNNNNLITKFNGGVIANNTGQASTDPVRATEFPIALAKVVDVTIEENFVETVGVATGEFDFSSGINVEHMSRDVTIQNNVVAVNRTVDADQNNQGITVLPFQDHGNSANSEEATVGVRVINNTFYGAGRSGIFALGFRNLEIDGNNFSNFASSREGLSMLNLFNTDDNGNGVLDSNERSTLIGSFVNIGATSNIGSNGLVEQTLFNTGDPSDLPPHLRD